MENRQKIPVPRRSFLWSLNETSGEILTHIGPTEFTPSANDRIVRANDRGGYEQAAMEARPFVLARDGEYVLLHNPGVPHAGEVQEADAANGPYVPGGNKERDLQLGTTKIIPGPCAFPLWPGQSAEVRPAHKLGANHYLLVEVVGPLDEGAPYYDLVMKSAGLSSVVIDAPENGSAGEPSQREVSPEADAGPAPHKLRIGQRIVVQGRHTSLFIPPTGIEVVPAQEEAPADSDSGSEVDALASLSVTLREELSTMVSRVEIGMTNKQFSVLKNELRHRSSLSLGERAVMLTALDEAWAARPQAKPSRRSDHRRHPHQPPMDPYARKAVVLGPKNFCILFDADGNPRIVKGPARVFPGPHDTFLQRGSRRRVYDAYELGENQALWLRIISPISREELARRLPPGYPLELDHYEAGHELLVRGLPSVYFPFIEAEVLNPDSGEPHVGNDHESVVIHAIGVDPVSGIYVRDRATGKVRLIRGEVSYLVDPRKEEHVVRRVSAKDWNLWIAATQADRETDAEVETPWALSVYVPTNHAALVSSRQGRRVIVGPATELLDYGEQLTALSLSKGAYKTGHDTVATCFVRIHGNRVRDRFELEAADLTRFSVELGIAGHFEGEPEQWFAVEDPVKHVATQIRSRIREAARKLGAIELMTALPGLVRDLPTSGQGEPVGLRFADCGVVVDEVEVQSVSLLDSKLASAFTEARKSEVQRVLEDRQAKQRLASVKLRDTVDAEEHAIQREANRRMTETGRSELDDQHQLELRKQELEAERDRAELERRNQREQLAVEARLSLAQAETEARAARKLHDAEIEAQARKLVDAVMLDASRSQAEIDRDTAAALAEADSRRLAAIQPELVGALHAAADAEVMKAAAQNMNLVSLIGGKSPIELFSRLLEGTPLARTVRSMRRRDRDEDQASTQGREASDSSDATRT
jgi:major vault protein